MMTNNVRQPMEKPDLTRLRTELLGLFEYIKRVRQEIAAINQPPIMDNRLGNMNEQLDAIVKATEEATHTIMEATEKNEGLLVKLRGDIKNGGKEAILNQMSENNMSIFEACSFQDITGQRVTKLVKSVTYVDARVRALIDIWGKSELEKIVVTPERDRTADEKLLNGPALEGQGVSQDEIDKLFD
jgi:chemotaxis protein CheZ